MKFRYRGRHAAPAQSHKIAVRAAKAAPALAIAGVIVGAPQLHGVADAATAPAAGPAVVHTANTAHAVHASSAVRSGQASAAGTATLDAVTTSDQTYQVQAGDTLSGIAQQVYGNDSDWPSLYNANTGTISNPNLIYPGQVLSVPSGATDSASQQSADTGSTTASSSTAASSDDTTSAPSTSTSTSAATSDAAASTDSASASGDSGSLSGTLGCSGLEQLWDDAGGNPADAFMAAEIAMAESSGDQYAVSSTDDIGYWQINAPIWGSLATFDPVGNADAAIQISDDGSDWGPWSTYQSGAYEGQC